MSTVYRMIPTFAYLVKIVSRSGCLFGAFLVLLCFLGVGEASGQQKEVKPKKPKGTAVLEGRLMDGLKKPLPFVVVQLFSSGDSASLKGLQPLESQPTDSLGVFRFSGLPQGSYVLVATYIGFSPFRTNAVSLTDGQRKVLSPYTLTERSTALKQINIVVKKPFIERMVDKTVLNIESDILASGETALEVLKKAPGVTIDKDDRIQIRGKQGVTVMLDGKLTYLSQEALTNLLKNTPASSIDQIEIITQPSAKYDASGNTGIINIKSKKLKKMGLNGILTTGAGLGLLPRINESINLNYKSGPWNVYGNYDYTLNQTKNRLFLTRYVTSGGRVSIFDQETEFLNRYQNHSYKAGVDYDLTKDQTLGIQVNGYSYHGNTRSTGLTNIRQSSGILDSLLSAHSENPGRGRSVTYNVNYRNVLDTAGQELSLSVDYSKFNNLNQTLLTNTFYLPKETSPLSVSTIRNVSPSIGDIRVGKGDYTLPFSKSTKLELGLKYSWVKTDNMVSYDSLMKGIFVPALSQTNQFIYTEKVSAGYASINHQWKKTGIVLGLRLERTVSNGNSVTLKKEVKRQYLDIFPNFSISQKLDSSNQLGFSYSRRIDRPSYQDLNPFRFYLDQYTYQEGNPYLQPQYTHSFELSETFKQSTIITLNFSWTKDVAQQILTQNDTTKVTKLTTENLDNLFSYSLTLSRPFNPTPWWTIQANLNANYNKFASQAASTRGSLQRSKIAGSVNLTNTLTFPDNWSGEITGFYNSPALYGFLEAKSQTAIGVGLQKTFLNKKATAKLNVNDIFWQNRFAGSEIHDNVRLYVQNQNDSRTVNLSFTYRFGTNPDRKAKATASEQEQNRIKK